MEIQVQAVYMRKQMRRWSTSCVELLFLLQNNIKSSTLILRLVLRLWTQIATDTCWNCLSAGFT